MRDIIKFRIDHIDPLGQGVSKGGTSVAFIEKTLPGETGTAEIYRRAKGVLFGRLSDPETLEKISPDRIEPECSHFYRCRGCQYLHTNYETEIEFKVESLKRKFTPLLPENTGVVVHPAANRFFYRNRIQLHFDFGLKKIGLISSYSDKLISGKDCLLPSRELGKAVKNLYIKNRWIDYLKEKNITGKGYIEIYLRPGESEAVISINKPYARGGFTQVNNEMGSVLTKLVEKSYLKYLGSEKNNLVLDLFGGNGNLSNRFDNAEVKIYDLYPEYKKDVSEQNRNRLFVNINLYSHNPVNQIKKSLLNSKKRVPDLIILDPPRAGVKYIESYITTLNPPFIFYISCDPATLKRDSITILKKYNILEIHLIDLFPGTRHFETLIIFYKAELK